MAAASHLNIAPLVEKTSLGITLPTFWQPHATAMHVARPKSAKGRTRSSLNHSHSVEAYSYQVPLSPQPLAPCEEAVSGRKAALSQQLHRSAQASPVDMPDLLQQVPVRTSSSLNKYRVLPSINKRDLRKSAVDMLADQLRGNPHLEEDEKGFNDLGKVPNPPVAKDKVGGGDYAQVPPLPLEAKPLSQNREEGTFSDLNLEEPSEKEPRLLLAIRSPSGQRFERHFRPTDSLKAILAVAEQKNLTRYKSCSIETVEVPRRTFSDLTRSLQECAIPHKSVLCIQEERQEGTL